MKVTKRKRFSAEFEAKVDLEATGEELTTAEPMVSAADVEKLQAKIGQLVVERDAPQRFRGPAGATITASVPEDASFIPGTGGRKR